MAARKVTKSFHRLHAIQLTSLSVVELFVRANQPPDPSVEYEDRSFSMSAGHSDYDAESRSISISLKLEIGMDDDLDEAKHPFSLRVEVMGDFSIKEDEFPIDQINDWAKRNAPFILYPYVREHAFALTARCGFRPILLPLLEVPTLVFDKERSKQRPTKSKKT